MSVFFFLTDPDEVSSATFLASGADFDGFNPVASSFEPTGKTSVWICGPHPQNATRDQCMGDGVEPTRRIKPVIAFPGQAAWPVVDIQKYGVPGVWGRANEIAHISAVHRSSGIIQGSAGGIAQWSTVPFNDRRNQFSHHNTPCRI